MSAPIVLELEQQLASAQATCAKLHDLNHMQAQRIEQLEQDRKAIDLHSADLIASLKVAREQAETRAKRIYELEQELLHVLKHAGAERG